MTWDNKNKDWIVNVNGKYICRTKDIDKAGKIASKKIKELITYADKLHKGENVVMAMCEFI